MSDDSSTRIVADLRRWIASVPPGTRLPSSRELRQRHRAGPATVQKALHALAAQGLVESRPGVGTFTLAIRTPRTVDFGWQTTALGTAGFRDGHGPTSLETIPNSVIGMHSGYPCRELLPEKLVRAAFARATRAENLMGRPPVAGLPDLQSWFATELAGATPDGVAPVSPSDVVVIPGSQSGLVTAFRALAGAGRPILVESPTYWGAMLAARQAGVQVVPVPSGPAGPSPEAVAESLGRTGARVFYAQPTFANATGWLWPRDRADAVLDAVRAAGAFLIEDDWAHDFAIDAAPQPLASRDDAGHVVYLRSLTKSVAPATRVAGLVARGPARDRILADHGAEALYVSGILQTVALDVVTQPAWRTHLRRVTEQLRGRRDLLLEALVRHAPQARVEAVPRGGLNAWVRLPDDAVVADVVARCRADGLTVGDGGEWFPAEPAGRYVRMNYAAAEPSQLGRAAEILGAALR
ncbi:PLP-dependent aminotransferase family protein [Tsukamurella sp. 8F]|uniref:aminotransferase-like domain-containing protein n=1 Tax=unclassified Tsukamurella TaxID=2633480 RepID=UPI0023B98BFF|nr:MULTISPECIES: PLP-dependent aminotransferase family protein [unclassified Tsukamurella]MDF0529134.1 PLP-dependent aminotransferase family protein [Tsukamurella sp. 8J]MDF0588116.1 PLP-dependent aminotransferase family protein [Tsukamurella sp. 8F]